jgi:2-hydroxy-6-oxonona-2,4-dienedioate hydrolase
MSDQIFKSEEAHARLDAWYRVFLGRLSGPVEHREVPTSAGPSHVLLAGAADGPPLVALHGSLAGSAHVLSEMGPLLERYRVIAPDLPGQSARGPQVRLSLKDDSMARWLLDTLDGLGVESFDLFGVSWGGFVARLTASMAPERVRSLTLLVPAGIVRGSVWTGVTQVALPMLAYRLSPSDRSLRRVFDPLFTTWDDNWAHYMGDAFRDFVLDLQPPPLATEDQLRRLAMPTLVFGASQDISFPGEKLIQRVEGLIPNVETELILGSRHCPPTTDEFRSWMADRVSEFLEKRQMTALANQNPARSSEPIFSS